MKKIVNQWKWGKSTPIPSTSESTQWSPQTKGRSKSMAVLVFLVLATFLTHSAMAQLKVYVGQGKKKQYPIAIPDFKGPSVL